MKSLSDLLEKLSEKYPDDQDLELAIGMAGDLEGDDMEGEEDMELDMEFGMEDDMGMEGDMEDPFAMDGMEDEEEDEDIAELDILMGKKKAPKK